MNEMPLPMLDISPLDFEPIIDTQILEHHFGFEDIVTHSMQYNNNNIS